MVNTIRTPYGDISETLLKEFCFLAGYNYDKANNEWSLFCDEIEYWQLVNPGATGGDKRWAKKPGKLAVRDLNFQYACLLHPKFVTSAANQTQKTKVYDVEKAMEFVKQKLFVDNKPVYLPELLAVKIDGFYDPKTKPPKSYNKILEEAQENFKTDQIRSVLKDVSKPYVSKISNKFDW